MAFGPEMSQLLEEFGVDWRSESGMASPKGFKKKANAVLQSFFPQKSSDWGGNEYEFTVDLGEETILEAHVDYGGLWQMRLGFTLFDASGVRFRFEPGYLVGSPITWCNLICESNAQQALEDLPTVCAAVMEVAKLYVACGK